MRANSGTVTGLTATVNEPGQEEYDSPVPYQYFATLPDAETLVRGSETKDRVERLRAAPLRSVSAIGVSTRMYPVKRSTDGETRASSSCGVHFSLRSGSRSISYSRGLSWRLAVTIISH